MFNFHNTYLNLPSIFYKKENPTHVLDPKLAFFNYSLAKELGLSLEKVSSKELALFFSGNKDLAGSEPIAQSYAGHQFGHFTMLGDGRAILLGEHLTNENKRFDVQLKGSGETVYSRRGDGRAALAPMLRECIISEAMHALNIPTTRGLAVVSTGEEVFRTEPLPGAILTRVAKSHIRVGTFEYISAKNDYNALKELADYTINRHYSDLNNTQNKYQKFLEAVIDRQAFLISKWMLVGFIHGVMNTDNMAISGETIDYGPCAFLDNYKLRTVFSSIDRDGRYSYGNQPAIAQWNLARFAETLLPLINSQKERAISIAEELISEFSEKFQNYWLEGMGHKLGIEKISKDDFLLCSELLELMEINKIDYTEFFANLTYQENLDKYLGLKNWFNKLKERQKELGCDVQNTENLMQKANPIVIPRNHIVEEALYEAQKNNDFSKFNLLLEAVSNPYNVKYKSSHYAKPPDYVNESYKTFCGT